MKNNIEFLESIAKFDSLLEHNVEECGHCYWRKIAAQVAREMLEEIEERDLGEDEDVVKRWADEHEKRWYESKYCKLFVEERKAGRDPKKAFDERGWIM